MNKKASASNAHNARNRKQVEGAFDVSVCVGLIAGMYGNDGERPTCKQVMPTIQTIIPLRG
jgi:hypothetical protein